MDYYYSVICAKVEMTVFYDMMGIRRMFIVSYGLHVFSIFLLERSSDLPYIFRGQLRHLIFYVSSLPYLLFWWYLHCV